MTQVGHTDIADGGAGDALCKVVRCVDHNADVTTTVAETAYIDTLEKRDMDKSEIIFYGQNTDDRQNFYMEEKAGDPVNETMRMRDIAVEEHLNVTPVLF